MTNELYHFGVKGMHWGVRRYQNRDGSYTAQGRGRYATSSGRRSSSGSRTSGSSSDRRARIKKAAKIGAGVAAAGLAAYGGYRLAKSGRLRGLKALPNNRLALPGPTSKKSAASRVRSAASKAASKVSDSNVGRRVKRGINSAQYHATRVKNEASYRWATRGSKGSRSNGIGLPGSTYSRAGRAASGARRAASAAASGARRVGAAARRTVGAPGRAMADLGSWAVSGKTRRSRVARELAIGAGAGAAMAGATGIYAQSVKYRNARRRGRDQAKKRRR